MNSRLRPTLAGAVLALAALPTMAGPATATETTMLTAAFADRQITPDETSVLTFTITNGRSDVLSGLGFEQPMPKDLSVTSYGLRKNCGSPTVTGVHTLKVAALTVAPRSVCTVEVVVMPNAEGTFEVSPRNASITGNLTPGQGDVLRVRNASACADSVELLCKVPLQPAAPKS